MSGRQSRRKVQGPAILEATKAIRNDRVCVDCAKPIPDPLTAMCPRCGGQDIDARQTRPRFAAERERRVLPFPWNDVGLKRGATVLLAGAPGSGKTTICLGLKPTRHCTSEQEAEEVAATWFRIHGPNAAPPGRFISNCTSWEDFEEDLEGLTEDDLVVMDSISQLGSTHQVGPIMQRSIERVRKVGANCIFIAQYTKDGSFLGPNELAHLVDVVAEIPDDNTGMRRLMIRKNRGGNCSGSYFTLTATGPAPESFPYAYSVEGPAGNYRLQLYPYPGSKLTGILDVLSRAGLPIEGTASAALECAPYSHGFGQPSDAIHRQAFAEAHGLTWISPELACEQISDAQDEEVPI
jgi:hypothetical protein